MSDAEKLENFKRRLKAIAKEEMEYKKKRRIVVIDDLLTNKPKQNAKFHEFFQEKMKITTCKVEMTKLQALAEKYATLSI